MRPGDRLTLTIEKPAAGGRMIARHEGAIVLVAGTIPGETVESAVERVQRGTIWARTLRVVEPSADRIGDAEEQPCGGNVLAHVRYARQLDIKRDIIRDAFARIGKMDVPGDLDVAASPVEGYRMRARLHVQRSRVGFFREGTHTLCDAASTRQLLPSTIEVLREVERGLQGISHAPDVELQVAEDIAATQRAIHFDLPDERLVPVLRSVPAIDGLNGVSCDVRGHGRSTVVAGSPEIVDALSIESAGGPLAVTLARHAHSYFQGNRYLLVDLIAAVTHAVPAGAVTDLYAGVGPFAVTLAARGDSTVVAVEGDSRSAADLAWNAANARGRIAVRHRPVEAFLADSQPGTDATIVADPPRTGMSRDAVTGVIRLRPHRIVYVSCDVATLARDARLLTGDGYRLTALRAFDMFPNTAHIETLALFDR